MFDGYFRLWTCTDFDNVNMKNVNVVCSLLQYQEKVVTFILSHVSGIVVPVVVLFVAAVVIISILVWWYRKKSQGLLTFRMPRNCRRQGGGGGGDTFSPRRFSPINYHNGVGVLTSWTRLTDQLTSKKKKKKKKSEGGK